MRAFSIFNSQFSIHRWSGLRHWCLVSSKGLTEFLPVSSSGHFQIFSALFGLEGEENLTFAVAVHAATV